MQNANIAANKSIRFKPMLVLFLLSVVGIAPFAQACSQGKGLFDGLPIVIAYLLAITTSISITISHLCLIKHRDKCINLPFLLLIPVVITIIADVSANPFSTTITEDSFVNMKIFIYSSALIWLIIGVLRNKDRNIRILQGAVALGFLVISIHAYCDEEKIAVLSLIRQAIEEISLYIILTAYLILFIKMHRYLKKKNRAESDNEPTQ